MRRSIEMGIAFALLPTACVTTTSVVRDRFATEHRCPAAEVAVAEDSATRYRARGCEHEAAYVCSAGAAFRGGVQCVEEGIANPPSYREPDRSTMPPPDPRVPSPAP